MSGQDRLDAIAEEIREHRGCGFEPCETCLNQVPGEGPSDAGVMLVGEAPGAQEDKAGRPFVGNGGKLLDQLLETAGLKRDELFITNVLKARPPGNRNPRKSEIEHSLPWLLAQLDIVRPRLIVPLGRFALGPFAADAKITEAHGRTLERDGRMLFPMYHPAAALRREQLRDVVFEDARKLGETYSSLSTTSSQKQ
jgi:uracil-DNA glycosylase family 4